MEGQVMAATLDIAADPLIPSGLKGRSFEKGEGH
jgi:hypothetical protein